jgi:hypothetical protein
MGEFSLDPLFRLETHRTCHMLNLPQASKESGEYVPFEIHCLKLVLFTQRERILQWYMFIILAEISGIAHFLEPKPHYILKAGSVCLQVEQGKTNSCSDGPVLRELVSISVVSQLNDFNQICSL